MIKAGVATGNQVQEIFNHAKKHGYALPAINVVNTSSVKFSIRISKR
jgi:fructose-bisphosphate aldolase class II